MTHISGKFLTLALSAMAGMAALSSCSHIDEDERFIYYPRPEVAKNVLIAEFSGIGCTNCPYGAEIIHDLIEENDGHVIAVSFHPIGSPLTNPIDGFMIATIEAREYYVHYGSPALPAASIDGMSANDNREKWSDEVDASIKNKAPGEILLHSSFDGDTRKMTLDYKVEFNKNVEYATSFIVWITESGIIGPQKLGSETIKEYTHNHVFRARATDMWGIPLASSYQVGDAAEGTITFDIPEDWNADNCNVVGLLIDSNSKLYLQASEIALVGGDNYPSDDNEDE